MRVVAINASPKRNGNTARLLRVVLEELEKEGIGGEVLHIGGSRLRGCIACHKCGERRDRRCIQTDDPLNEWMEAMWAADGILLGSPTYFANVTSEMKALIDRAGLVALANGGLLRRKVGAPVIAVRRGGEMQTYGALMAFFGINQMIVPCSSYWNFGLGLEPGDVENDAEGIRTMRDLGKNMAFVLRRLSA
jgi:multimeric flavodoxin WrbA